MSIYFFRKRYIKHFKHYRPYNSMETYYFFTYKMNICRPVFFIKLAFLFWSIAVGIVLAAGLIPLAVFGSAFIGLVLWFFSRSKTVDSPSICVVHCEGEQADKDIKAFVSARVKRMNLKSKSVEPGCMELHYELRLKEDDSSFVNGLDQIPGVSHVTLVSYNGDYMG